MSTLVAKTVSGAKAAKAASVAPEGPAWFSAVVEKLNLEKWFRYVGLSVVEALHIFYFFIGAFFVGFVFKKYFKFVIGCAIVITVLVITLESKNLIAIDWTGIKGFVGLDPARADLNSLWSIISDWVYANLYCFIAAIIGFIIGYRLG